MTSSGIGKAIPPSSVESLSKASMHMSFDAWKDISEEGRQKVSPRCCQKSGEAGVNDNECAQDDQAGKPATRRKSPLRCKRGLS